jgi:hypothetical protein
MAFNQFTAHEITEKFGVRYIDVDNLFSSVRPVAVDPSLTWYLKQSVPLALSISTEKARSEMIITPILIEARRLRRGAVSLFSGTEFVVDQERGLNGFCDYLFSLSRTQIEIEAPVVAIVEAKNENIRAGIPQCVAEMLAARIYNERRGRTTPVVFGAVTSGSDWRFLQLREHTVEIDTTEYYARDVDRIVGVLVAMLTTAEASIVTLKASAAS